MTRLCLKPACAAALLFNLFGALPGYAQVTATDLLVRIDQLENQVRQLTGAVEQLQFRNQQLETNLRKIQEDNEFRFKELGGKTAGGPARSSGAQPSIAPQPSPQHQSYAPASPQPSYLPPPSEPTPLQPTYTAPQSSPSGRRSDAFDPSQNPNAPGAPRPLGSIYASSGAEGGTPARPGRPPAGTGTSACPASATPSRRTPATGT